MEQSASSRRMSGDRTGLQNSVPSTRPSCPNGSRPATRATSTRRSAAARPKRTACTWERLLITLRCMRQLPAIRCPLQVPRPSRSQARVRACQHPATRRTGRQWPSSRRSFLMSTRVISITSINCAGSMQETILRIGQVTDCTWSEFLSLCRRGREAGAVKGRSSRCLRSR